MRHPQIVVFESDRVLAHQLEGLAEECRWLLRESRQGPACLSLLRDGGPAVLVLKVGRNLQRELTFLTEVHAAEPDVPVVVIADHDDVALLSLALELGASYVIQPPQSRQELGDIVKRLLESRLERSAASQAQTPEANESQS